MTKLSITEAVELRPGEIRALAKLSKLHPHTIVAFSTYRDSANVGWGLAVLRVRKPGTRAPFHEFRYIVSPTGRVWTANTDDKRIEPPIFDADYADQGVD